MPQSNKFSSEPVTTVLSWTVKHGKEQLFEHVMHDIHKVARTFPGHMGVTTLQSPTHKDSFQTILRFDNTKHLETWLSSPIRQKMMKPLEEIAHIDTSVKATGLETWFEVPGQLVTPPPKWKMVVATFIAIYPVSLLFTLFLAPHIATWHAAVRALFLPVIAPIILTYLFMPFLTQRLLKHWLYKNDPS
ncbi:MAG: antibiotic biosynthesis monooxygenase [Candidatus Saccharibacteria bacterium]|nr:antibiotic biosynthesis monooxygenase [Candidatus Saccharibacteria bacterium]